MGISKEQETALRVLKRDIDETIKSFQFEENAPDIRARMIENAIHLVDKYVEHTGVPKFNELLGEIVIINNEQLELLPFLPMLNSKVSDIGTYDLYLRFDTGTSSGIKHIGTARYRGQNIPKEQNIIGFGAIVDVSFDEPIEKVIIDIEIPKKEGE